MLAFSITASSLELGNGGAITLLKALFRPPVSAIGGFASFLSSGVRELNPFATHTLLLSVSQAGLEPGLTRELSVTIGIVKNTVFCRIVCSVIRLRKSHKRGGINVRIPNQLYRDFFTPNKQEKSVKNHSTAFKSEVF
jgi:hypothetical protein